MKKLAVLFGLLCVASAVKAQTVSPIMGLGTIQVFDNNGLPCPQCVIYSYQAGSTTQQATYADSTGLILLPNPITLGTAGRANIWLLTSALYKLQICAANDGPSACSAGDVLATVDGIPGGPSSSGGSSGAPFVSNTPSPATSGVLRLSSGDSICWRNAAGSANLCIKKDSNDLFSLDSGSWKLPEVAAPAGVAGFEIYWADSTTHRLNGKDNGGAQFQYVHSGNDVGVTDQVLGVHFGSTQETFGNTAPTANQYLMFNGTNIVGNGTDVTWTTGDALFAAGSTAVCNSFAGVTTLCVYTVLPSAHTLVRLVYDISTAASGCTTNAVVGVRDNTSSSNIATSTATGAAGVIDSGALSISMTAGHQFALGLLTAAAGCTTTPNIAAVTAVYE